MCLNNVAVHAIEQKSQSKRKKVKEMGETTDDAIHYRTMHEFDSAEQDDEEQA